MQPNPTVTLELNQVVTIGPNRYILEAISEPDKTGLRYLDFRNLAWNKDSDTFTMTIGENKRQTLEIREI